MTYTDEPIENIDQAERYFKSMGCSHFHMIRENPQRTKEYKQLDIDPWIESEWIKEEFENKLENFYTVQPNDYGSFL